MQQDCALNIVFQLPNLFLQGKIIKELTFLNTDFIKLKNEQKKYVRTRAILDLINRISCFFWLIFHISTYFFLNLRPIIMSKYNRNSKHFLQPRSIGITLVLIQFKITLQNNIFIQLTDIKLQITITSKISMQQVRLKNFVFSQIGSVLSPPCTPSYSKTLPYNRNCTSSNSSYCFLPESNTIIPKQNHVAKANLNTKQAENIYLPQSQNNRISVLSKENMNATISLDLQHNFIMKQQQSISPYQTQVIKPKILFSYNKDKLINQKEKKIVSLSLNNKESTEQYYNHRQFSFFNSKKSKDQKRFKLKIQNNVIEYVYIWNNQNKKQGQQSHNIDKSSQSGKPTKCSGTSGTSINSNPYFQQHQNRLSKISFKNTQSFLLNTRRSGFPREKKQIKSNQKQNYEQHQSNYSSSSKKISLMDKLATSKNLKKTIILSSYDFGGIFIQQNSKIDQKNSRLPFREKAIKQSTNIKWKNIVKCLVQQQNQTQNLKQSIHCGPQIRLQKYDCQLLDKFGRNIASSIISSAD